MPTITDAKDIPDSVVDALGMPKHEIVMVADHKDGTLAQTKDGNVYIIRSGEPPVVQLYVPAHPKVKLPIETYRPGDADADLGLSAAQPVAPEVALALQWRQRQLEEAAERDGLDIDVSMPTIVTDPLADASTRALVTDAGPQPADEVTANPNPADQKPDEPTDPQPAEEVVEKAQAKQRGERGAKS